MRKSGISTVLTNILWTCLFERTLKSNDASSFWPPKIAINESLCANIHDSFGINHRFSCEKTWQESLLLMATSGILEKPSGHQSHFWMILRLESCSFRWLVSKHVPAEKQHYISFKHQVAVEKSQWVPGHFTVFLGPMNLYTPDIWVILGEEIPIY